MTVGRAEELTSGLLDRAFYTVNGLGLDDGRIAGLDGECAKRGRELDADTTGEVVGSKVARLAAGSSQESRTV